MAWLQLLRAAAIPTALSNILLGYLIASGDWQPVSSLLVLLIASASLYSAGMVFNDVFDIETDRKERPSRPLPAGSISVRSATFFGVGLVAIGLLASALAGIQAGTLRPVLIAIGLTVMILLYDGPLKKTRLGPLAMGSCRFLNILLGASLVPVEAGILGYSKMTLWIAFSIGVLIAGTTAFGRNEARKNKLVELLPGAITISTGVFFLLATSFFRDFPLLDRPRRTFPLLLLLIAAPIFRNVVAAFIQGSPQAIQKTVGSIIRSLIIIDAAFVWLVSNDQLLYPLLVLLLLIPSFLLGRLSKIS